MTNESNILHRAMAAVGAVAITMSILVSYFAAPQVQAASVLLA